MKYYVNFDVLNISSVLYPDYFYLKDKSLDELEKLRNTWFRNFIYTHIRLPQKIEDFDFLFFRSMVRDDYKVLAHEIASTLNADQRLIIEDYKVKLPRINLEASRFLIDHYSIFNRIQFGNSLLNSCCFIRFIEYLFVSKKILSYKFKYLVAFADMQPVENLLVQLTKLTNRKTVTLQHGLYVDYGDMDTVNIINYKNHCSDYFLAWGNSTKRLIEKYHNSNIIVCGKPSIYGLPESCQIKGSSSGRKYLVILDQRIFDEQNFAMLAIACRHAKNKNTEVFVRFHPQNNKELYLQKFPNVQPIINIEEDFVVIGHTSSMIYEALVLGYESYRYSTEVPSLGFPSDLTFTDDVSFDAVLKANIRQSTSAGKDYIDCTGLESKVKYKNFFNMLLGSKR
jgi:hypothetical protein